MYFDSRGKIKFNKETGELGIPQIERQLESTEP